MLNEIKGVIMEDVQKTEPKIKIVIPRVGISNLKLPVSIMEKGGGYQNSVADISVYVDVEKTEKGTHMSRLSAGVHKFSDKPLSCGTLVDIVSYIKSELDASQCEIIYKFPYFIKKLAPVSKLPGFIYADVVFKLISTAANNLDFSIKVNTTTTSLCACSKAIADNGAHNQRSKIDIECFSADLSKVIWIEDIVELAEKSSACPVYSVLKRVDEKYVTEAAYANPGFVEDIVRLIYSELVQWYNCRKFIVEVSNEESIHQHNAYARMCS